jgi:hypothetical protein
MGSGCVKTKMAYEFMQVPAYRTAYGEAHCCASQAKQHGPCGAFAFLHGLGRSAALPQKILLSVARQAKSLPYAGATCIQQRHGTGDFP